ERAMRAARDVERSRAALLEEDVAWADVVVSSLSTSIIEALFADVPVFVHVTPDFRDVPATSFLDPQRTFFRASELAPRLDACLRALANGDPEARAPEARARESLFGPGGAPRTLLDWLERPASAHEGRAPAEGILGLEPLPT